MILLDQIVEAFDVPQFTVFQGAFFWQYPHGVLVIIYHVLRTKKPYCELGADYFDKLETSRIQQHHIHHLEQLGFTVTLTPKKTA